MGGWLCHSSLTFALVKQPHGSPSRMFEFNHICEINGELFILHFFKYLVGNYSMEYILVFWKLTTFLIQENTFFYENSNPPGKLNPHKTKAPTWILKIINPVPLFLKPIITNSPSLRGGRSSMQYAIIHARAILSEYISEHCGLNYIIIYV